MTIVSQPAYITEVFSATLGTNGHLKIDEYAKYRISIYFFKWGIFITWLSEEIEGRKIQKKGYSAPTGLCPDASVVKNPHERLGSILGQRFLGEGNDNAPGILAWSKSYGQSGTCQATVRFEP